MATSPRACAEPSRRACPEPSRRAGRTLSVHELARFFASLAATGNFALACESIGRAKSGLYKRRARDPVFAADVEAALAQFRMEFLADRNSVRPEPGRRAVLTAPGTVVLGSAGARPQLRRSPPGRLTRAGVEAFLKALAATANIRFAAASVGIAASSIHRRRRVDPSFARAMERALDAAAATLELRLLEDADRTFDPGYEGEPWLDPFSAHPEPVEGRPPPERMTIDQALRFLNMRGRGGR